MITKLNPYLSFNGNCEKAFNFYRTVFGGEYSKIVRYNEIPRQQGAPPVPEEIGDQIRHIELPLNNNIVLMGNDNTESVSRELNVGNNVKISIIADEHPEGKRLFEELSAGGTIKVPFSESFWGSCHGSLIDKFGIHWFIEVPKKHVSQNFEDNANIHIP